MAVNNKTQMVLNHTTAAAWYSIAPARAVDVVFSRLVEQIQPPTLSGTRTDCQVSTKGSCSALRPGR